MADARPLSADAEIVREACFLHAETRLAAAEDELLAGLENARQLLTPAVPQEPA